MTEQPRQDPDALREDFRNMRREVRTALEMALVELAPSDLIDRLALVSGLLDVLTELPGNSSPMIALGPSTADRGRSALDQWRGWWDRHRKLA